MYKPLSILYDARITGQDGIGRCTEFLLKAMDNLLQESHGRLYALSRSSKKSLPARTDLISDSTKSYTKSELTFFTEALKQAGEAQALICMDYRVPLSEFNIPVIAVIHDVFRLTDPSLCYSDNQFIECYGVERLQDMIGATQALDGRLRESGFELNFRNEASHHERYYTTALTWATHRADYIVTCSKAVAADIGKLFPQKRKIAVVPWGLDHLARDLGERPGNIHHPFILYVGQNRPHKNFPAVVEAFASARKVQPNLSLVCVGRNFENRNTLSPLFNQHRVSDSVHLLGAVNDPVLCKLYHDAAALVHLSTQEGFGLTPHEALYVGGQAIVSDIPVLHENLDGVAEFVDPSDIDAVARKINIGATLFENYLKSAAINRTMFQTV